MVKHWTPETIDRPGGGEAFPAEMYEANDATEDDDRFVKASDYDALAAELAEERAHSEDLRTRWEDLRAHAEVLELQASDGWHAFNKLRRSVGEDRYPGMTAEVTALETKGEQG